MNVFVLYHLLLVLTQMFGASFRQASQCRMMHFKCRGGFYPRTDNTVARFPVPDEKIHWDIDYPEYQPTNYTAAHIKGQSWADPEISHPSFHPQWNQLDGSVNRKSHVGVYKIENLFPLNPVGRTGVCGRGCLGRWGPNHAADPIVTRWKRTSNNEIELHSTSEKKILQFVAIQRRDTREWAIPGGMVDPGEVVTTTLKREFFEEALDALGRKPEQLNEADAIVTKFFESGETVYKGYVDDPRNTDNAWMETVAVNFHDETGLSVGKLPLSAGDDAVNVRWMDVGKDLELYASHIEFIEAVAEKRNSHW
ncbi:ADP-ribose pyrophosphatase, mitochondrial [Schistocerca cancellata]|uniref:ADP-ribose pyrophosphatase, mitochondrial n=1 Tax=Schistocerca cancellata TaxID=274614 RepID=UPI002118E6B2|nr:ADP-ribose pyrophosphatase, mitochondrial [Schistocerca cancellata]